MKQEQFLNLATAEEAEHRFWNAVQPKPISEELVSLDEALGRILSRDVKAKHNVPFFDRSNYDGFAVRAEDTFGAQETEPIFLSVNSEVLACGIIPESALEKGTATIISTGGVLPRGADGVMMVENTLPVETSNTHENGIHVLKPIVPGSGVSLAGSDIGVAEVVLRVGDRLGFRETGTLAAIGENLIWVWKKPKVGIISTGDELVTPGEKISVGKVYDSNTTVIAHAVQELGCIPVRFGIIKDDEIQLKKVLQQALELDFVLLSGGTSKGVGDLNYKVFEEFHNPGILVHGVSLKPGKPLCLALLEGTPAAILPGFPTSSTFTYYKFVAPVLRAMAGLSPEPLSFKKAKVPIRINSDKGRTEFHMVHLIHNEDGYSAYSTGKGSGSITGFARADGFMEIPQNTEMVEAGDEVEIQILGENTRPADLMIIGSHCIGLDFLIGELQRQGVSCQFLAVGSMGGVLAVKRGESDFAGSHLMDEKTGIYNQHLLSPELRLIKGYKRKQGLLFRKDDSRFTKLPVNFDEEFSRLLQDSNVRMINRNRGSGTRVLLDQILNGNRPAGFYHEAKSHHSVASAIEQKRADWGIAIETAADQADLGFFPIQDEEYDFIISEKTMDRKEVNLFFQLLKDDKIKEKLFQQFKLIVADDEL